VLVVEDDTPLKLLIGFRRGVGVASRCRLGLDSASALVELAVGGPDQVEGVGCLEGVARSVVEGFSALPV